VAEGEDAYDLAETVNELLADGWLPLGGVSIATARQGSEADDLWLIFAQVMMRDKLHTKASATEESTDVKRCARCDVEMEECPVPCPGDHPEDQVCGLEHFGLVCPKCGGRVYA